MTNSRTTASRDPVTSANVEIDYEHAEIHAGDHFRVQGSVAAGTSVAICFKTPNTTTRLHAIWEFAAESKATITCYEGATWDTNTGTRRNVKNSRRDSSTTSTILGDGTGAGGWVADEVVITPTTIAGGSTISLMKVYAARFAANQGQRRDETVLKSNTQYALVMSSDDGAKDMWLKLAYYEHADHE